MPCWRTSGVRCTTPKTCRRCCRRLSPLDDWNELVELVISRPRVSAGMIAKGLGLREMTGRGRFGAWG
ncbi:hypothetical protein D4A92_07550 [Rhizobium rosettiformans]|uniref:Uncharacterized protein n=1 Tax=Rhizobium rosettiformans TaxID=1368430 RepID=A0ABX7F0V5_9HYPH|nr:hypothetical protein D4A92_07550 [Rhizobium rosettiformans]